MPTSTLQPLSMGLNDGLLHGTITLFDCKFHATFVHVTTDKRTGQQTPASARAETYYEMLLANYPVKAFETCTLDGYEGNGDVIGTVCCINFRPPR